MDYLPNDILLLIVSRLDNRTLESISKTILWNLIVPIIRDQSFWKLRVEHLIGRDLPFQHSSMKEAWYILQEESVLEFGFRGLRDISNTPVIKILILLGFDPSVDHNSIFRGAVREGCLDVVTLLLQDERTDPSDVSNEAIQSASYQGHVDIIRLLLVDPRVNPSIGDNYPVRAAVNQGHEEAVLLLLQDPRVDLSSDNNFVSRIAQRRDYTKVLRHLETRQDAEIR